MVKKLVGLIGVVVCFICTVITLSGCGVDEYVFLYPVTNPHVPTADPLFNYFSFTTSDKKNTDEASGYFKGFEIYYRIYNSESGRDSDVVAINNYNSDNPSSAYSYLINTKNYCRLSCAVRPVDFPLIPESTSNRPVVIGLGQSIQTFVISVAGDSSLYGEPRRTNNGTTEADKRFIFDEIDNGDSDYTYSSSGKTDTVYIQAYALAYGYDQSYKSIYSELCNLGYVTIVDNYVP